MAFSGAKSRSPHSKGKLPLVLKDFRDKSSCFVTDTNSSTSSYSESPIGISKEENYFNRFDSFTFHFSMTMPIMVTDTTTIEEQLAEMARTIAKLTKIVDEKDM